MLESTRGGGVNANADAASIVVVENWIEEVKQRVPLP